jgi:hypothetical protein
MDLKEREAAIARWATLVSEAEKALWYREVGHNIFQRPKWSLADWDNYLDARQLWPHSTAAKHYHRAFDLGIRSQEMAELSRAVWKGNDGDLLRAIESGIPATYQRTVNDAYQDRLIQEGFSPSPYPTFATKSLHSAGVPAEYAAVLLRAYGPVSGRIIDVFTQGIAAEFAVELVMED